MFLKEPNIGLDLARTLFVDPENPENDLKIISIDRELDRWGGVGLGATLA
jgi:hypothetical protein